MRNLMSTGLLILMVVLTALTLATPPNLVTPAYADPNCGFNPCNNPAIYCGGTEYCISVCGSECVNLYCCEPEHCGAEECQVSYWGNCLDLWLQQCSSGGVNCSNCSGSQYDSCMNALNKYYSWSSECAFAGCSNCY